MTDFKFSDETFSKGSYQITINPSNKYQYFHLQAETRLTKFMVTMQQFFLDALDKRGVTYDLHLELSVPYLNINKDSPSPGGRLHFHGVLKLDTLQAGLFLLEILPKLSRHSNITYNPYTGKEWDDYILKNLKLTKTLCDHFNLPYSFSNKSLILRRKL